jgi:hypothetical protein
MPSFSRQNAKESLKFVKTVYGSTQFAVYFDGSINHDPADILFIHPAVSPLS